MDLDPAAGTRELELGATNLTEEIAGPLPWAGLGELDPFGVAVFLAVQVVPSVRERLVVPEHIFPLVPPQEVREFLLVLAVDDAAVRVGQLEAHKGIRGSVAEVHLDVVRLVDAHNRAVVEPLRLFVGLGIVRKVRRGATGCPPAENEVLVSARFNKTRKASGPSRTGYVPSTSTGGSVTPDTESV
jgi:hypothetical protein